MGTRNFHNVNASKIFSRELENDFDFDDFKEEAITLLTEKFGTNFSEENNKRRRDYSELPSFPSTILGTLFLEKKYNDFTLNVYVDVVIRSGYYSGCNLDYTIRYNVINEDQVDLEDIKYDLEYHLDYSNKKSDYYLCLIEKWIVKNVNPEINKLESVFENLTISLDEVAVFSNGEAIYKKA